MAHLWSVHRCLHLHLHLQIVSVVALVFVTAFALGVYRFACVCRFPLRLHLCYVCVYTCIALTFALVLPCCSLCTGVALGLHLSLCFVPSALWKETLKNCFGTYLLWCAWADVVGCHCLQSYLHCSHSMISETLAVCLRVCKCFAPAFVYEIWLE